MVGNMSIGEILCCIFPILKSRADWTPVELFRIAIGEILPLASEIEECLVDFSGS